MTSRIHAAFAVICVAAVAAAAPAAWAGRVTLNDTGMTQCVGHRGSWSSDCAKSLQDAADGRDVNHADPEDGLAGFSFRKVCRSGQMAGEGSCPVDPVLGSGPDDWGCVYDNVSQLTWEAKTDDDGMHDGLRPYTNKGGKARDEPTDAAWLVDSTNAEGLCGATNWKLPDAFELQSIVHYGMGVPDRTGPFIDPAFFPNTYNWDAWTRTEYVHDSKWAWYVDFTWGDISIKKRYEGRSARLVHGGAKRLAASSPEGHTVLVKDRFIPSADGTEVTDTMTGLVWRRCAEGMVWNNGAQTCDGDATEFYWEPALDYARANRKGGWRIPNVKELFSIVDHELNPAIDLLAFPNAPSSSFLSSTPVDFDSPDVYVQSVSFGRGSVWQSEIYDHGNRFLLRLVRRGRE